MRRRVTLIVSGLVLCTTALTVQPVEAKQARTADELLDLVAGAHQVGYHAKQLVVYFGERESAAMLDIRSSSRGRSVRASSGRKVIRSWSGSRLEQVAVDPVALTRKYDIAAGEPESLLGEVLVPLTLTRRDDDAVAERWWVHPVNGVVYKREQFDGAGELVGLSTTIEMNWDAKASVEPVDSAPDGLRAAVSRAPDAPEQLPGGYRLWRSFDVVVDSHDAQQWVYSDGLHALSIFRADGRLATPDGFAEVDLGDRRGWSGPGPGTWAFEGDSDSFLVVAEEVGIDPRELLEPLPKPAARSIWERLGSVWSRLFRAIGSLFS